MGQGVQTGFREDEGQGRKAACEGGQRGDGGEWARYPPA